MDRCVKSRPTVLSGDHGLVRRVEGGMQAGQVEALPTQPVVMRDRPRVLAAVGDTMTQQQLAEPVPGAHQFAPGILPGTHHVARGLLGHAGNAHRHDLTQPQQLGDVQRVTGVGLHALINRPLQLRGREHLATHTSRAERTPA